MSVSVSFKFFWNNKKEPRAWICIRLTRVQESIPQDRESIPGLLERFTNSSSERWQSKGSIPFTVSYLCHFEKLQQGGSFVPYFSVKGEAGLCRLTFVLYVHRGNYSNSTLTHLVVRHTYPKSPSPPSPASIIKISDLLLSPSLQKLTEPKNRFRQPM